jgi:hypothetical protein
MEGTTRSVPPIARLFTQGEADLGIALTTKGKITAVGPQKTAQNKRVATRSSTPSHPSAVNATAARTVASGFGLLAGSVVVIAT